MKEPVHIGRYEYTGIFLAVFAVLLSSSHASAETREPGTVILVVPQSRKDEMMSVVRAVQSQLSDLDVILKLHSVERLAQGPALQMEEAGKISMESGAVAVFWIEFSAGGQSLLYIVSEMGRQTALRRISENEEESRAEAIAVIVRASLKELLMTGSLSLPDEKPAEKQSPVQMLKTDVTIRQRGKLDVKDTEERRTWICQELAYALYVHSGDHPAVHGLNVGFGVNILPRISLAAGYTVQAPVIHDGESATIQLERHPASIGPRIHFYEGIIRLTASISLIIDYSTFEITELSGNLMSVRDNADTIFSIMPALEVSYRIIDRLQAVVTAGAEISINARHYVTPGPGIGEQEILLDSWPVQPWILAGIRVDII